MPRTKNNFLNAKPVSKMGGGSGGVRKPSKPYSKPPAAKKATPKVKPKAAKPTPKPVAPTVKGPVPRPGLQNRGGISAKDLLPNSARRDTNLPKDGSTFLRNQTQGPKAPTAAKAPQVVTKPVTRSGPVKGPVPPKGGSVTMPNSRRAGVNLPKEGVRAERTASRVAQLKEAARTRSTPKPASSGAASGAGSAARGLLRGAGRLAGRVALPLGIGAAAADVMRVGRQNQRWNEYKQQTGMNKSSSKPAPAKPSSKPQQQGPQQTQQMVDSYRASRDARHQSLRADMPAPKPRSTGSNSAPARTPRPAGTVPSSSSRTSSAPRSTTAPRSQTPPAPRFTGSVDEGRKLWAEKYSSSKYDGQVIQKEAKKLLEKMKERKEQQSAAQRAGWDGNKNY